jgi:hypothetical protein
LINIAGFVDERGLKVALRGMKLIIPRQLQFVAERLMVSNLACWHCRQRRQRNPFDGHAA